jgi:hypothetical protein
MAAKRTIPAIKKVAPKVDDRAAQLKEAAAKARADDDRTYTHQGPGTGQAGAAEPVASAAILGGGRASSVETKSAALESAASQLRDRAVEDQLDLAPAAGQSSAGKLPDPKFPGQQTADGGTASTGGGPEVTGGLKGPVSAFDDGAAAALDADVADALGKLSSARPDLRSGLDVFDSAAGSSSAPGSVTPGTEIPVPGRGGGSDGGAEHSADAVGQVTSGGRSLFDDRLAGVSADLAISEGLIGDQQAAATSPSVADGGNPITDYALKLAGKAADGDEEAYGKLERLADQMHKDRQGSAVTSGTGYGVHTNADGEVVAPGGSKATEDASPFLKSLAEIFTGNRDVAGNLTVRGEMLKSTEEDSVEDPGDPLGEGGKPTPAEMAFRKALREQLGVYTPGGEDVDPVEDDNMPVGTGAFAGAANNNLGLIGQPVGPVSGATGTMRPPPSGTDVDPVEGSAYSGPALGGNPEDLSFGSSTLPLDSARRSSASSDDDADDDTSEDDDDSD